MPIATVVPDLLSLRAAAAPDVTAVLVDGGPSLTYREWADRSDRVAAGLAARGVTAGDRVVLHFDNAGVVDYAVCYIAVHKAGAVAVPTSPRFSAAELARIVEHTAATLVVATADPPVEAAPNARAADLENTDAAPPRASVPGTGLAEIIYTSGTTGTPKGVACSHASILNHDLPGDGPEEPVVFAHAFPVGTNAGQECLRMPLRRPATAVVLPTFDPERLCAVVAERGVERLQLVPAMAEMLLASGAAHRHDVSSVERIVLSSAPAPPNLWPRLAAAFPDASLWNAYALTESGSARTLMRYDPDRPGCVGRPVGRTEVRVVDDAGGELPRGEVGEVQLRRPGAPPRTYYRDQEATAAAFDGDWLRTGDLGFLDEEGCLHLVDRKKDLIIRGGMNISPVEVEHALHTHPAVADAAVFAVPHPSLGQDVAAAVVVRAPVSERELQASVRAEVGEEKVPRRIHVVDDLPRNATGKVLRRELAARFADQPPPGPAPGPAPADDVVRTVLAVLRDVLGRDDVGLHDDFFALGGQSLAAAQAVARLEDAFPVRLPVTAVFEHPTAAELARAVRDAPVEAR